MLIMWEKGKVNKNLKLGKNDVEKRTAIKYINILAL